MASPTSPASEPYQWRDQRGSTAATRRIVESANTASPSIGPEYHSAQSHPAHSHAGAAKHAGAAPAAPTLQRRKTNNYEQALAERATGSTAAATATTEPMVVQGMAYRGEGAESTTADGMAGRPSMSVLGRQQSWKVGDQKRAQMEKLLTANGPNARGYSSSGAAVAAATPGAQQ